MAGERERGIWSYWQFVKKNHDQKKLRGLFICNNQWRCFHPKIVLITRAIASSAKGSPVFTTSFEYRFRTEQVNHPLHNSKVEKP